MNSKIKYYLRGLGTGIVVTTLVLTISFSLNKGNTSGKTDNELSTTAEPTTKKTEATTKIEEATTKKEEPTTKKEEPTTKKEEPTTKENSGDNVEKIKFSVESGMTSNAVADLLQSLGIIEDANDFNMYLYNNGFESRIRVGTFEVEAGADYSVIASIITSR